MTPDVKGTYEAVGRHNVKPYYQLAANGYFIWWDLTEVWAISTEPGLLDGNYWVRNDPNIEGLYGPLGTAVGDAVVTVI